MKFNSGTMRTFDKKMIMNKRNYLHCKCRSWSQLLDFDTVRPTELGYSIYYNVKKRNSVNIEM